MRLLTAGSLVRAQHGEPKKKVHAQHGLSSLFSVWLRNQWHCISTAALAVNWLGCCRRLWRREAAPEQEKTRSETTAVLCLQLGIPGSSVLVLKQYTFSRGRRRRVRTGWSDRRGPLVRAQHGEPMPSAFADGFVLLSRARTGR